MRHLTLNPTVAGVLLGLLLTSIVSSAAEAAKKAPAGKSVLTPGIESHRLNMGPDSKFGEFTVIDVKDQPFKKVIRARVKQRPEQTWFVQISTLLAEPVKRGDVVMASFHVRKVESKKPGGDGVFSVYFGTPDTDLEPTINQGITIGAKWTLVQIPAEVAADYQAGKGMLNLDLGNEPQLLEFGDIKLVNYGRKVGVNDLPKSGF